MSHVAIAGFTLIEIMLGMSIMVIVLVAMLGSFFGQSFLNANARTIMAAMNDGARVLEQIRQQNAREGCTNQIPSAAPPAGFTSWDAWLAAQTPSKNLPQPTQTSGNYGSILVACQEVGDQDGDGIDDYCGDSAGTGNPANRAQVGRGEWGRAGGATTFDPIRITVAACWAQMGRTSGECNFQQMSNLSYALKTASFFGRSATGEAAQYDLDGNGVITIMDVLRAASAPQSALPTTASPTDTNGNDVIDSPAMLTTLVTCR